MATAQSDGVDGRRRGLVPAVERFIAGHSDRAVIAIFLASFVVLWTFYNDLSKATIDADSDISEVSVWAQDFGLGYKHPPLQAWVFRLWFSIFPREIGSIHLLTVTMVAVTLAFVWRILRDHADPNRALLGTAVLTLGPLYTFLAQTLDANTLSMPFWAAASFYYLRARRGLGTGDALLAGALIGFAFLAKYWAVYLALGIAVASLVGPGTARFWRSPVPYLMAVSATVVFAPYLVYSFLYTGGESLEFVHTMMGESSMGQTLAKSAAYLFGSVGYVIGPLLIFVALRPGRSALADTGWPGDPDRWQAVVVLAVAFVLPALINLAVPHRLTPIWTYPNWALLPLLLYASPALPVDTRAAAIACLLALALVVGATAAAPFVAYARLGKFGDPQRAHFRGVAEAVQKFSGDPVQTYWGTRSVIAGLAFYIPHSRPLLVHPSSPEGRAQLGGRRLIVICSADDAPCLAAGAALGGPRARTADVTLRRSFLGFSGPDASYRLIAVPPATS
jgi:4-amino-4-deoxy-L-arabinose transferase-like glycosyltransferase